jgi:glycerophosphoryl diester phosphodiesterase
VGEGGRGKRRMLLPAMATLAGLAVATRHRGRHRPGSPFLAGAPLLIAHRGGAALAPEDTMIAFRRARDWWRAEVLELDVQPSRDGEAVVIHDPTLERTTDGEGPVAEHTLDEIRALDAGYRFTPDGGASFPFRGRGIGVPTLVEVLSALPDLRVIIEIKDGRTQDRVWESIRECDAVDRVLIAAGDSRNRAKLSDYPVPVSAGKTEIRLLAAQVRLGRVLHSPRIDALQVPDFWEGRRIVTPKLIAAADGLNVPVHVWTVNEIADMERLLDWGAAGLVTDRPDRLSRLLNERVGRPLPPGPPAPLPEPFLERLLLS